ncbi:tetraspanin [Echinococcus multilocularis]|uniref:Tetraspanin n=1 Tax=Echinococcus multilocularis TaxID=6211 RepID=A0A0S4MIH2_ECHMU|nr:tetraspanin [Echinococcus multilocularis]
MVGGLGSVVCLSAFICFKRLRKCGLMNEEDETFDLTFCCAERISRRSILCQGNPEIEESDGELSNQLIAPPSD